MRKKTLGLIMVLFAGFVFGLMPLLKRGCVEGGANNALLLRNLAALGPRASRACHFSCALALVAPDGREFVALGQCPGTLLHEGRGSNGFGYDPLFLPDGWDRTFAELPSETKCTFSHRARAAERMRPILAALARA